MGNPTRGRVLTLQNDKAGAERARTGDFSGWRHGAHHPTGKLSAPTAYGLDRRGDRVGGLIAAMARNEFKEMQEEDLAKMMNDAPLLRDERGIVNNPTRPEAEEKGVYSEGL